MGFQALLAAAQRLVFALFGVVALPGSSVTSAFALRFGSCPASPIAPRAVMSVCLWPCTFLGARVRAREQGIVAPTLSALQTMPEIHCSGIRLGLCKSTSYLCFSRNLKSLLRFSSFSGLFFFPHSRFRVAKEGPLVFVNILSLLCPWPDSVSLSLSRLSFLPK